VGGMADRYLFGGQSKSSRGLTNLSIQSSIEGTAIPRIDGQIRMAGQLIWASKYTRSTSGGGKGLSSSGGSSYEYSISFALGFCAGEVGKMGRIWADGALIDPTNTL
jgi:hypothetical protein